MKLKLEFICALIRNLVQLWFRKVESRHRPFLELARVTSVK